MTSWVDSRGNLRVDVPLARLRGHADPYLCPPWDVKGSISVYGVRSAARRGDVSPVWSWEKPPRRDTKIRHVRRIAWYVANGIPEEDEYPSELDVGVSSLGYMPRWIVLDGNHRYAAALALGHETMPFVISGCLEDAEQMFGITIPVPVHQ